MVYKENKFQFSIRLRSESSADITNHASKELTPLTTLNKDNTQKTLQSKASASTKKQDALGYIILLNEFIDF